MIYLLLGLVILLFALLEAGTYNRWFSQLNLYILSVALVLFAALRDGTIVGTDSPAYYANYKYNFWQTEPSYKFLNLFFSKILQVDYNLFLLFLNSISLFLFAQYLRRNMFFYVLPILIFYSDLYLYFNLSGIRQAMALSFICYSFYFALRRNLKIFLLFVLLAASFHVSSLVFVFAYFIPQSILKLKQILVLSLFFIIAVFVGNYLAENFEYLTAKSDYYTKYQEQSENILVNYIIGIIKRSLPLFLIFLYRKYLFDSKQFVYAFNLYLVGCVIFVSTYLISPDFGVRFSVYYTVHEVVLIGLMLWLVGDVRSRLLITALYGVMCIYKLVGYMNSEYYIYKSIIDHLI